MTRNWYLLSIIGLLSATLLALGVVAIAAGFANWFVDLSLGNRDKILLAIRAIVLLVAIFGPLLLAKKYGIGWLWGFFGIALYVAMFSAFLVFMSLTSASPWVMLGPIGYLIWLGYKHRKRRRHTAATQHTSEVLNRFD